MTIIKFAGSRTTIPGWPECGTLAGILDAIGRWELDRRLDNLGRDCFEPSPLDGHFRSDCRSFGGMVVRKRPDGSPVRVYLGGALIYPDHPHAVSYQGNFLGYSWGFHFHTDDPAVIRQMDDAIAANLRRQGVTL